MADWRDSSELVEAALHGEVDAACAVADVLSARDQSAADLAQLIGHLHLANGWEPIAAVARHLDVRYSTLVASAAGPNELVPIVLSPAEFESVAPSEPSADPPTARTGILAALRRWLS